MIDLCFLHAETSHNRYRKLAEDMVVSFLAVAPGNTVVQFADQNSEPIAGTMRLMREDVNDANMMFQRVAMLRNYIRDANGDILCTDCDLRWVKDPSSLFADDFDIGLLWRSDVQSMPYLGGFIMIRQGSEAAQAFIADWWLHIALMPKQVKGWWGDQLALAGMLGPNQPRTTVNYKGAKVKLFDAGDVLHSGYSPGQTPAPRAYAVHFKGTKKNGLPHA